MNYTYLVPKDTTALRSKVADCRNLGLILARYVPQEAIFETDRHNNRGRSIGKERNFWLQDLCKSFVPDNGIRDLINSTHQRWSTMTEGAARFSMVARSRMIIGLGGKGALESGITLHPVTGLPYIPGSALKGLCRNYRLLKISEKLELPINSDTLAKLEEQLLDERNDSEGAKSFRRMFGTQDNAGECVFFDVVISDVPSNTPIFAVEVMTPHFRQYYESSGQKPPHDADDPKPITYIAVNTGITFSFAVGIRHQADKDEKMRDRASRLVQEALQEMGIGAKTASGYGVFAPVQKQR
jgi:CRISPR type III-B/RAMP module RAMP protein Cmr6